MIGQLVWLARFSFAFGVLKGMTSFASSAIEWRNPMKTIEHVCFLCAKVIRNKDKINGKLTSILSRRLERRSPVTFWTNTLCSNCAHRNETLVRKITK